MATRSAMARKTAGVRGKRITARQKAARRLNIAIARKHRKKKANKNMLKVQRQLVQRGHLTRKDVGWD